MPANAPPTPAQAHATGIAPSLDELQASLSARAHRPRTVPIFREVLADLETPVSAYLKITEGATRPGFLLESVEGGTNIARYSFLGVDPVSTLTLRDGSLTIEGDESVADASFDDPLNAVQTILERYRSEPDERLPSFTGGAVGYLAYDAVRYFEPRVGLAPGEGLGLPDGKYHIAESLIVFDHVARTMKVVSHVHLDSDEPLETAYERAVAAIDGLTHRLSTTSTEYQRSFEQRPESVAERMQPNTTPEHYRDMVRIAKRHIADGDIIQVVPSQRVDIESSAHPFTMYRALRMVNPSPYMFFLDFGDHHVVGASPELLVRLEDGVVTNHPIAGTRPRGATPVEDATNAEELLADEKERAEHVMLVDLGRNDVGRVTEPGSVHVPKFMEIERFSHVMHLVSHVQGRIADGVSGIDALRACFPAGTVSGAPKIRAMEIIGELEVDRRGLYSGAVGYFDFAGGMDTCIALRTMVVRDGVASLQAGGGVVADSDPESELQESFHKMRALVRALERAEEIESVEAAAFTSGDAS